MKQKKLHNIDINNPNKKKIRRLEADLLQLRRKLKWIKSQERLAPPLLLEDSIESRLVPIQSAVRDHENAIISLKSAINALRRDTFIESNIRIFQPVENLIREIVVLPKNNCKPITAIVIGSALIFATVFAGVSFLGSALLLLASLAFFSFSAYEFAHNKVHNNSIFKPAQTTNQNLQLSDVYQPQNPGH